MNKRARSKIDVAIYSRPRFHAANEKRPAAKPIARHVCLHIS
jgi:hypothetical protein